MSEIAELKKKEKNGLLAAGLNLVLPGVGYMYCGRIFLGIVAMVFVIGLALANPQLSLGLMVILVIDGFLAAGRYNKQLNEKIDAAMKTCPKCAEKVLPEAKVCKHCGSEFDAVAEPAAS